MRNAGDFASPVHALCTLDRDAAVTTNHHAPDVLAAPMPAGGRLRPRLVAALAIVVLAGTGGVYLGLMAADAVRAGGLAGPFSLLPGGGFLDGLCRADFARATSGARSALVLLMWCAMALAMMVPTAGPMVMTYAQIADTAARKGEPVASPLMLVGGYVAVWLGFSLAATVLQDLLVRAALLDPALLAAGGLLSGATFLAAGAYQFSALKHACLTRCQRPFPFFFANWTPRPAGVFRLGLRQGFYCVGCCWVMMLVMFAVGVMNVAWMAMLGIVMAIEKVGTGLRFTRMVGAALLAIGVVVLAWSIAGHWSAPAG
jgi:predicted metal-binding membrane protein